MKNLEFRRKAIEEGSSSKSAAEDLWVMCFRDPIFWINTFVWTYDPRIPGDLRKRPFVLFDYQEDAIKTIIAATGVEKDTKGCDLVIEKSRDMGASWICITSHGWLWHFHEYTSFLWLSRKEELVDKSGDPKSLFWKLDFLIKNEPHWLQPHYIRNSLHIFNEDKNSTIDGESTSGDMGTGDRRTGILLDEFAKVPQGTEALSATADATNARLFNSTHKGTATAFYMVTKSQIPNLKMHWSKHPIKARGLYRASEHEIEYLDKRYEFPDDYPFVRDGKLRSPWYDRECMRRPSKLEIAQELDMDPQASGSQFYDPEVLDRIAATCVQEPQIRGELDFEIFEDEDEVKLKLKGFREDPNGRLLLWTNLDHQTLTPPGDMLYTIGADVSAGSDASNSCASVGSITTGEKVAELATILTEPYEFADYCVALSLWFKGQGETAYLAWEANGPGAQFRRRVQKHNYIRVYHRRDESSDTPRISNTPGWFPTADNKLELHGELRHAYASGLFINRSHMSIVEARDYVYHGPSVEFAPAINAEDPSGAKANHGDRVVADGLCWLGMSDIEKAPEPEPEQNEHCFAARREKHLAGRRQNTYY